MIIQWHAGDDMIVMVDFIDELINTGGTLRKLTEGVQYHVTAYASDFEMARNSNIR